MLYVPPACALVLISQLPEPAVTPVPMIVAALRRMRTVLPTSAVPKNVGVVLLVTLSVLLTPLSLGASRSGAVGAGGGVVSIVIVSELNCELALPARSCPSAVIVWLPGVSALEVTL